MSYEFTTCSGATIYSSEVMREAFAIRRWDLARPGRYEVSRWLEKNEKYHDGYRHFEAVVDDFGTLVRVEQ